MSQKTITERPIFWLSMSAVFFGMVALGGKFNESRTNMVAQESRILYPIASDKKLFEKQSCKGIDEANVRNCVAQKMQKIEASTDEDSVMVRKIADRCGSDRLTEFLMQDATFAKYLQPRLIPQMGCAADDAQCLNGAKFRVEEIARLAAARSDRAVAAMFLNNPDASYILARGGCLGDERRDKAMNETE